MNTPSSPLSLLPKALHPGPHHVHHTYIWLGGVRTAFAIFVALSVSAVVNLVQVFASMQADSLASIIPLVIGAVALVIVLVAGLTLLYQWLSWKHLTYELGTDEISVYSGILNKKRMHVPYQRVQAVNQQAGLFQRIVGVCDLKIETAGGAANDAVRLTYLRTSEAEALRSELFRRKKVLLAGGLLALDGTATVDGVVYHSAWAVASRGCLPQVTPLTAYGYVLPTVSDEGEEGNADAAFPADASLTSGGAPGIASGVAACVPTATYASSTIPGQTNVLDAADEVMQDIRGVFGGLQVDTGQVRFETGLSNKELALAGASGAGEGLGLLFVGIIAVVGTVSQLLGGIMERWVNDVTFSVFVDENGVWRTDGPDMISLMGVVVLGIVALVAALWVISAAGTVVRYGGFRLRRREGRVEVEAGLLSRTFHGVDVDRVQSVLIRQSLIRRLIGYCEVSVLKIDSAAVRSDEVQAQQLASKGVVIHPFVKVSRVPHILNGVLPEFTGMPEETFKPAPVALRRAIVRRGLIHSSAFWLVLVVLLCQLVMEAFIARASLGEEILVAFEVLRILMVVCYVLFALAFVVNTVSAVLWYRRSGLGYNRSFMSMTNGGLSVSTTYTPRKKIQYAYVQTNPLQRRAKVASVYVRTAAGVGGTTEMLWDLSEEDAKAWLEWVRPHAPQPEQTLNDLG